MTKAIFNTSGFCPYCSNSDFLNEEERHSTQTKMQCSGCNLWSVRALATGIQYPLQTPSDKDSNPQTVSSF